MRRPLLFVLVFVLLPSLQAPMAAMYSFVDQNGTLHFTNVPADPRYREVPWKEAMQQAAEQGRFGKHIRTAAARYSLDPELIRAIIAVESNFNPAAVSQKGAMGLMQLMPDTAREMKVAEPFEAEANIMGGSRYLRRLLDLFNGDLELVLAAYNAGPNRVLEKGGIPRIVETEEYVEKVLREYGRIRSGTLARQ